MGNAFVAGLKNEAPRGRDITNEDRDSEVSQRGTQRDAEGSEFSYTSASVGYGEQSAIKRQQVQRNDIPVAQSTCKKVTAVAAVVSGHRARPTDDSSWCRHQRPSVGERSRHLSDYIVRPAAVRVTRAEGAGAATTVVDGRLPGNDPGEALICCLSLVWLLHCGG